MGNPGGKKLPTLSCAGLRRVIELDGWYAVQGTKHLAFEHPKKLGKVNLDEKWEHLRLGDWVTSVLSR